MREFLSDDRLGQVGEIASAAFFSFVLAGMTLGGFAATISILIWAPGWEKFMAVFPLAIGGLGGGVFCLWFSKFLKMLNAIRNRKR